MFGEYPGEKLARASGADADEPRAEKLASATLATLDIVPGVSASDSFAMTG